MKRFQTFGTTNPEESQREKKHRDLAREAAAEGIVLLENHGVLPLQAGMVALYGPGSRRTVKGGSGSGEVHERHSVTVEEGLRNAGFTFPTTLWMDRFEQKYRSDVAAWQEQVEESIRGYGPARTMQMFIKIGEQPMPFPACTPIQPDEFSEETDTAIYVLSRQAGEGGDRHVEKGDYLLSDLEKESLKSLSAHYSKLILVLNCGSVVDLSILDETRVDAVLFMGQGGMEGGNALADILTGAVDPSARLTDTWAKQYDDYPSSDTFSHRNGDLKNEVYAEGIYVGYRWFEKQGVVPRYPFGHGLSYTTFRLTVEDHCDTALTVTVQNTGTVPGREVVQVYVQKPGLKLDCEKRALLAFAKTKLLAPGERETLQIFFDLWNAAAFDEERNAYVLEAGSYTLLLGNEPCGTLVREEQVREIRRTKRQPVFPERVDKLLNSLPEADQIKLVTGGAYAIKAYNNVMGAAGRTCTTMLKKGIPNIVLSDGPAGLNVVAVVSVMKNGMPGYKNGLPREWQWGWLRKMDPVLRFFSKGAKNIYRYMTAWPGETVLAQTWDSSLLERVGHAVGIEMREIGISVWLAPGMNIHRNPLCGRNFEYFSEDPLVSGRMAAAVTRGVQSAGGVGVSIKHYCCNNQEDNRIGVSENVSIRALREIYLRAFEIAIREGDPWTVMSSYNRVNGRYVVNDPDLLEGVLREEWNYKGLVMSDWNSTDQCTCAGAINAGNDLIMPGSKKVRKELETALKEGCLDRDALRRSAGRVLELIFKSETCKDF
ncbi:MAG: glycoside hydrolase family 3 C-terminal domain-containing protein [Lachnospiraceae bacterium]|nr:glycoside hydrolase family 3 C-terminal domain-containing protein [Lachnospiraceae bacterium]